MFADILSFQGLQHLEWGVPHWVLEEPEETSEKEHLVLQVPPAYKRPWEPSPKEKEARSGAVAQSAADWSGFKMRALC